MTGEPLVVRNTHAAERDEIAVAKAMCIDTVSHARNAFAGQHALQHCGILWVRDLHKPCVTGDDVRRHTVRADDG